MNFAEKEAADHLQDDPGSRCEQQTRLHESREVLNLPVAEMPRAYGVTRNGALLESVPLGVTTSFQW